MKVASWNVRGFNGPRTQDAVVRFLKKHCIDIIGILETKIDELEDLHHILLTKFSGWRASHNFDLIEGGRIVICWNPQTVDVKILHRAQQFIHCSAVCRRTLISIQMSFVYGLYSVVARRSLWAGLGNIGRHITSPWVCLGDYNAYLHPTDKIGGNPVTGYMVREFENYCVHMGLTDLNATGMLYTWSNGHTWCKLDRALVNQPWLEASFQSSAEFLPFGATSDHAPCIVSIAEQGPKPSRPFRFYNMWTGHPEFQEITRGVWTPDILGTRQYAVCRNLKNLKIPLKKLNRRAFGHISERAEAARSELEDAQQLHHDHPFDDGAQTRVATAKAQVCFLDKAERSFYYQKAKCLAIRDGDRSTKFFHNLSKRNAKRNYIASLQRADGTLTGSTSEILDEFVVFYQELLGTNTMCNRLDPSVLDFGPCVQETDHVQLNAPVSEEEIRAVLFSIPDDKAPGPDGFSAHFFKVAWPTVGPLLVEAVAEFFETGQLLKQWNTTILSMIPKSARAQTVGEYRPIACCNVIYKIISKILSNRLAPLLDGIVDKSQSAFIKGRIISDNIHLAEQFLRQYERKNISPRCLLKIDIRKAYDSVDWVFLDDVLRALHFPDKFCKWIMACVTSPAYSIALNGEVRGFFPGMQGLRQGDPLSPYLFVLCIEYLSRLFKARIDESEYNYHPKCGMHQITHLAFADDLMVLARGDLLSVQKLAEILAEFGETSGLRANRLKSSLFLAGVRGIEKQEIEDVLSFATGSFPFRYLGIPLSASRLKGTDYAPLIDRITELIRSWTSQMLSYAGRLELLRSVVQGVCCYWLSIFSIPSSIIDRIEGLCRSFLWGSKIGRVSWRQVCLPREEGGLGLRDLRTWNKALLAKNLWNIHCKKDTLWVKWVNEFFLRGSSIWVWIPKPDSPPIFKNLVQIKDEMVARVGSVQAVVEMLEPWCTSGGLQVSRVYEWLRPRALPRPGFRNIWHTVCTPKHSFMVWLATLERLPTKDRLPWSDVSPTCVFCSEVDETHSHLFFQCRVVREIWDAIRAWLFINRQVTTIRSGLKWLQKDVKGTSWISRARRIAFPCLIYVVWTSRNKILKENAVISPDMVVYQIQTHVYQSLFVKFPEFERRFRLT